MYNVAKCSIFYKLSEARLHKRVRQKYMQVHSLLYLEVVSFPQSVAG